MAETLGPVTQVLAVVDGSDDHRAAAVAGADLLSSTPGLTYTVLAPADVAQPSGAPSTNGASSNGAGLLLKRETATAGLMQTVREIEDRGLKTKLRTVEAPLVQAAIETAPAHDLVILPRSRADLAERLSVPAILAP